MDERKKFDKACVMRWLKPLLSWDSVCEHFEWDERLLEKYQEQVNWTSIAKNRHIRWNASMIEKYKERIDWNAFSWQGPEEVFVKVEYFLDHRNWHFEWDEGLLEKYQEQVNWTNVAKNKHIKWDASMIEKFKERIDWNAFSWHGAKKVYTAEHLEKFKDYWNWYLLSKNDDFMPSKELLETFADYWDWDMLYLKDKLPNSSYYTKVSHSRKRDYYRKMIGPVEVEHVDDWEEITGLYDVYSWKASFLEEHKERIDWGKISRNPNIKWKPEMIEQFKDYIDWDAFSGVKEHLNIKYNPDVSRYTSGNLERYKNYWNWTILSENGDLQWTKCLLDDFVSCWDWSRIVNNWGVIYHYQTEEDDDFRIDTEGFIERYWEYIPKEAFQTSLLKEISDRKGDWSFVLTEPYLEKYANQMDQLFLFGLSYDSSFEGWSYYLLDKLADKWGVGWSYLINNQRLAHLFSVDFVVRYQRYIPWDELEGSLLGEKVREELCGAKGKDLIDLLLTNKR